VAEVVVAASAWAFLSSEASLDSEEPLESDSGRREERRLTRGRSLRSVRGEAGVDFVVGEDCGVEPATEAALGRRSSDKTRARPGGTAPEVSAAHEETPSLQP
jgi:hypothetical protein